MHGGLAYTLTLLPDEKMTLYHTVAGARRLRASAIR
jgi:hypothetical protein